MAFGSIREVFDAFNSLKVLVIGDSMIDTYVYGAVNRISPEAPVPVVEVHREEHRLGGAANVALNLQALGAEPILASIVGDDTNGALFRELMAGNHLPSDYLLTLTDRPTTQKKRVLSGTKHLIRLDQESTAPIASETTSKFLDQIQSLWSVVDVVIIEDYDKGLLTPELIHRITSSAHDASIPVCVDPKFRNFHDYKGVDLFKPNLKELEKSIASIGTEELNVMIDQVFDLLQPRYLLLTLGSKGMIMKSIAEYYRAECEVREVADVSGAGDTVIAVASLALAIGLTPGQITDLSNLAGGIVCEYSGVVPVPLSRLMKEANELLSFN